MRLGGCGLDRGSGEDEQRFRSGCCAHSSDHQNTESHARKAKHIFKIYQDALGELKMKYKQNQMSLTVLQMNIYMAAQRKRKEEPSLGSLKTAPGWLLQGSGVLCTGSFCSLQGVAGQQCLYADTRVTQGSA